MWKLLHRWSGGGGPYIRPWGLATPVLVLIVCLPLLRPLLRPTEISDNERQRLATIEAIGEHKTLSIEQTSFYSVGGRSVAGGRALFAKQPPVMAALLAGPYWIMTRLGLSFERNPALAAYLVTLLGSTLPVAAAGALIYRLGRIFELGRAARMGLAMAGVFASGLVSYATVLNSHAPAAALLLACVGCLLHAGLARGMGRSYGWLGLAGLCVALAAVIDMAAIAFLILLTAVILSMRWPVASKVFGLGCYVLGAVAPIALHVMLTVSVTGDIRPGFLKVAPAAAIVDGDEEEAPSGLTALAGHLADGTIGAHGIVSHFPIVLMGLLGVGAVLHRHWPGAIKALAGACVAGAVGIIGVYVLLAPDWNQPMYSVRWFIVFMPVMVFWSGEWLRRRHHPVAWVGVVGLLLFSVGATLIGATAPFTSAQAGQYTVAAAVRQLVRPNVSPQALAGW